jgi:hypothetical protein
MKVGALIAGVTSVVLLVVWWWDWSRDGVASLWLYSALSALAAIVLGTFAVARRRAGRKPVAAGVGAVLGGLVLAYYVLYVFTAGAD